MAISRKSNLGPSSFLFPFHWIYLNILRSKYLKAEMEQGSDKSMRNKHISDKLIDLKQGKRKLYVTVHSNVTFQV